MRKRMALGLFMVLVLLASVCLGEGSVPAGGSDEFGTIGATVLFGRYEQDNDFSNGSEKIEWIVLDVQDGKSLLLSKYLLDSKPYNDSIGETTWAECSLREWLNHEFMDSAFTGRDQERILPPPVENEAQEDSRASAGSGFSAERPGGVSPVFIRAVSAAVRTDGLRDCAGFPCL